MNREDAEAVVELAVSNLNHGADSAQSSTHFARMATPLGERRRIPLKENS